MNANELADKLENEVNMFDHPCASHAADMLRSQEKYINLLHKLCNANGIGVGRNLLTGEVIPFEVAE